MKTTISVCRTEQISMDDYAVVWESKTFDDNATIFEIKEWIIKATHNCRSITPAEIGLSNYGIRISDTID